MHQSSKRSRARCSDGEEDGLAEVQAALAKLAANTMAAAKKKQQAVLQARLLQQAPTHLSMVFPVTSHGYILRK